MDSQGGNSRDHAHSTAGQSLTRVHSVGPVCLQSHFLGSATPRDVFEVTGVLRIQNKTAAKRFAAVRSKVDHPIDTTTAGLVLTDTSSGCL